MHEFLGISWLCGVDPEVFPVYLGLPWGLAIGPLPNFPLPTQIHTRVGKPIVFERFGKAAVRDRNYVDACYSLVQKRMQQELNSLLFDSNIKRN